MEFIDKKYLFRQHRYIAKDSPVHAQRLAYLKMQKKLFYALDPKTYFDRYFMFWLGGFFEKTGYFKIIKKKKFYFSCILFHLQYKLLRWIRYQLNFGLVLFNVRRLKFFFFTYQRQHINVLIAVFIRTLMFTRTLRQFFLWAEYSKLLFKVHKFYSVLHVVFPTEIHKGFFFGLLDNCARFKIYTRPSSTALFKTYFRFIFYCDIPIQEQWFFQFLFKIFSFPVFTVRSSLIIRVTLNTKEDCLALAHLLFKQKLFNRVLRINFLNWHEAFDYLYFRPIKYRRKHYFKQLLHYFYISSYSL